MEDLNLEIYCSIYNTYIELLMAGESCSRPLRRHRGPVRILDWISRSELKCGLIDWA